LVSFEAANPLSLAFWPLPISLVWQVLRDDGSPYLHLRYLSTALLDGIPGEAPGYRLLFPLQALMISREPGEHAVTLSPKGAGIAPARMSSCQGSYLVVNPLKSQPRRAFDSVSNQRVARESHRYAMTAWPPIPVPGLDAQGCAEPGRLEWECPVGVCPSPSPVWESRCAAAHWLCRRDEARWLSAIAGAGSRT
jgi:hypothetical protein